jgi:hypothetical protein
MESQLLGQKELLKLEVTLGILRKSLNRLGKARERLLEAEIPPHNHIATDASRSR